MPQLTEHSSQATQLGAYLDSHGIKRTWLAQQFGLNPSSVTLWCLRGIPKSRLNDVARVLGVEPEALR